MAASELPEPMNDLTAEEWPAERRKWARYWKEKRDSLKGKVVRSFRETEDYEQEMILTFTDGTKLILSADYGVSWHIKEPK